MGNIFIPIIFLSSFIFQVSFAEYIQPEGVPHLWKSCGIVNLIKKDKDLFLKFESSFNSSSCSILKFYDIRTNKVLKSYFSSNGYSEYVINLSRNIKNYYSKGILGLAMYNDSGFVQGIMRINDEPSTSIYSRK